MFIYNLSMICEELADNGEVIDISYETNYVCHEKQFSKEEFKIMCEEAFDNCHNEQSNYIVKLHLKNKYKFKDLPIETIFEFVEKFE